MLELLVLETKLREPGAERRDPLLDPDHGVHDRLGVAQGVCCELPIALAQLHFREPLADGAFPAIGVSHGCTSFRVTLQNLGEMPWLRTGYLR
jgi:hypothetical protein